MKRRPVYRPDRLDGGRQRVAVGGTWPPRPRESGHEAMDAETTEPEKPERFFAFEVNRLTPGKLTRQALAEMGVEPCDTIECPAAAAGVHAPPDGETGPAVLFYDRLVSIRLRDGEYERPDGDDIIPESDVREAWLDALSHLTWELETLPMDEWAHYRLKQEGAKSVDACIEAGADVARTLGWLDDDETVEQRKVAELYDAFHTGVR